MPQDTPQPQDLVLSMLGSYLRERDQTAWSGGLVRLLGEFGFSVAASRMALTRLVHRGLLEPSRSGRLVHYRPTQRNLTLMAEGDTRIFSLGREPRAPRHWTVVWHNVPEERRLERSRLGRRLRFLGFGPVQDGNWLSPHDRRRELAALIAELDVARWSAVLVGQPSDEPDFGALVARVWDVADLTARYRAFVEEFDVDAPPADEREAFVLRTRLTHRFREFPSLDPDLPDDLLPNPAARRDAVTLFDRLYTALEPTARAHFEAITSPAAARDAA